MPIPPDNVDDLGRIDGELAQRKRELRGLRGARRGGGDPHGRLQRAAETGVLRYRSLRSDAEIAPHWTKRKVLLPELEPCHLVPPNLELEALVLDPGAADDDQRPPCQHA